MSGPLKFLQDVPKMGLFGSKLPPLPKNQVSSFVFWSRFKIQEKCSPVNTFLGI